MGVGVDEARRDQTTPTVVLAGDGFHERARLVAMLAAPGDLLSVADDRGVLDHAGLRSGEEPADVAQAIHLCTTVSPPTTTLVTSRPEYPYTR